MTLPLDHPPVVIALAPPKAEVVDREAAAARVSVALELAARVNAHAKQTPAIAANAFGVEAGLANRANELAALLRRGAFDEELVVALDRLSEAEESSRDILQRVSFADHDRRAVQSPEGTIRVLTVGEPLS